MGGTASRRTRAFACPLQEATHLDDALAVHDDPLRILPRNVSLRTAAARFWIDRGDGARALELLDTALREQPNNTALAALRIRVLATDSDPAVRDQERAQRLIDRLLTGSQAQDPRLLGAAAAAAAEQDDIHGAIELAQRAASQARERGADVLAERIEAELDLYRTRRPGESR
ncbi:MAG: putative Zn-dependent protease [Chlamydiales bacterium]|jgi:predicted Zn-dependent protease